MKYDEKAKNLFCNGCNCAQAVFCAFNDILDIDYDTAMKLSSSFGGGMGRLREVCGAVSGMFMVCGMLYGYNDTQDNDAKTRHYQRIQELAGKFVEKNGSIVCRELLSGNFATAPSNSPTPEKRTPSYYKKRPCADLVADAALIMSEYILQTSEKLNQN